MSISYDEFVKEFEKNYGDMMIAYSDYSRKQYIEFEDYQPLKLVSLSEQSFKKYLKRYVSDYNNVIKILRSRIFSEDVDLKYFNGVREKPSEIYSKKEKTINDIIKYNYVYFDYPNDNLRIKFQVGEFEYEEYRSFIYWSQLDREHSDEDEYPLYRDKPFMISYDITYGRKLVFFHFASYYDFEEKKLEYNSDQFLSNEEMLEKSEFNDD